MEGERKKERGSTLLLRYISLPTCCHCPIGGYVEIMSLLLTTLLANDKKKKKEEEEE